MRRNKLWSIGYYEFVFDEGAIAPALSRLLSCRLSAECSDEGFFVPFYSYKKYKVALSGIDYCIRGPFGLFGEVCKMRRRFGIFAAFAVTVVLAIVSSLFVWDVRIEDSDGVSRALVEYELERAGLAVGDNWNSLSLDKVETEFLSSSQSCSWISIDRRGTVAYVKVRSKESADFDKSDKGYSNIVAARDCVIEEITVRSGLAVVKVGDSVKAGDLLISGVIPAELGGGFVRADGDVVGRLTEQISVFVPREESYYEYENEILDEVRIKILNFSVNIFKNYGNSHNDCVIIEDTEEGLLLGKYRVPFKKVTVYTRKRRIQTRFYNDGAIVSVAAARLSAQRTAALSGAELLRISTYGEFTDNGYSASSVALVLRSVAKSAPIT